MRIIDAHTDTITKLMHRGEELLENPGHVSLKKLEGVEQPVVFFAIYMNLEKEKAPFSAFLKAYDYLEEQVSKNSGKAALTTDITQIEAAMAAGKVAAVPAIEEGGILEGSIKNLYKVHEMGIKYITLTWNFPNEIGEPAIKNGGGLTDFGKGLLKEMNSLGVLADVSHLSEKGFWDVHRLSNKPFIASHSNAKAICGHFRNLTDDQLKALGEAGGVTGLNICPAFLCGDGDRSGADIDDLCRHLDHMIKFAGEGGVGIGTDFDGIGRTPRGMEDASKLPAFHEIVLKRFGAELTDKVFFGNFFRVLKG